MKRFITVLAFLVFVGFQLLQAQAVQITGNVTSSEDGAPLPGVTVVIQGTTVGTVTDFEGNYTLTVPGGAERLIFSFIGMKTQEVSIGDQTTIDLVMEPDVVGLDEVVVTALGISREKKALGYSISTVDGEEFTKARETNIMNSLSGQVAGINVTNSSGAVGSSTNVTLRGASSLTGNNQPLYVVDGIPIDNTNYGTAQDGNAVFGGGFDLPNGISDINPDDIESVSVLKGPSAAALYGLRAANGVILIKTKRGGAPGTGTAFGVSVNSSTTFETPLVIPDFQNSYGQGPNKDYFEWIDGTVGDGGVDESWGPPLDVGLEFVQWNSYTVDGAPLPWVSRPDNVKNFYETGLSTNNNIAFNGGSDRLNYRLSLGQMLQTGIIPNTNYKKYTVTGNTSYAVTNKLRADINATYIKSISDNLPTMGYAGDNPIQQTIWFGRNVDLAALKDYKNLPLAPVGTPAEGTPLNWNTQFQNNPYWNQDNNLNKLNKDRLLMGVNLSYNFTDWLMLTARTGVDYWASVITEQRAIGTNEFPEGTYRETDRNQMEINYEAVLAFNKDLAGDLSLELNLGANRMDRAYNRIQGTAPQLELPGVYNLGNVKSGVSVGLTNFQETSRINSVFGFGQVSFQNAIFLSFSGRNDWASVLPMENNSFFYPSVNLSGIITEYLNVNQAIITFLKVRGGWSQVGSIGALEPYSLQQTFTFRDDPWGSTLLVYNPDALNNPNLKSETTTGIEIGIDSRFVFNRVRLDVTYFDQKSTDLIVPVEISAASGYITAWSNVGEMTNKGIEVQLGVTPLKTGNWTLDFDFNYYKNNNKVESLGGLDAMILGDAQQGGQWNVDLQARAGQPYGTLWGPKYERDPASGKIIHEDGIAQVSTEYGILGDIQPDWRGGVVMNLTYKGIRLNSVVDAKMGGDIYTMTTTWGRYAGVLSETLKGRETGIIGDGVMDDGTGNYVPNNVVVTAKAYNQSAYDNSVAEGSVFDASYIKLRQVLLSYNLPSSWFSDIFISNASVSLVGRNLVILWKKVPHIDPETSFSSENFEQGCEFGQIPSVKSLGFNLNINF